MWYSDCRIEGSMDDSDADLRILGSAPTQQCVGVSAHDLVLLQPLNPFVPLSWTIEFHKSNRQSESEAKNGRTSGND